MKKLFLIVYGAVVFAVTIGFLIFGERRDPRFYLTILVLAIVGKLITNRIE